MKHNNTLINLIKRMALVVLLGLVVFGCGPKQPTEQKVEPQQPEMTVEEPQSEDIVYDTTAEGVACDTVGEEVALETDGINIQIGKDISIKGSDLGELPVVERDKTKEVVSKSHQKKGSGENLDDYAATLEVTKRIFQGDKGTVNVWVGKKKYMPKANIGMVRDTTPLYNVKAYAKIIPHADSCIFKPESVFMPVDSGGSLAQFDIKPQKLGKIEVKAEVLFYDDENCSNLPKPSGTQVLSVRVRVDYWKAIWDPVWDYFKVFWGSVIALVFGALLYVIRNFIKKKTGYSDDIGEKILGGRNAKETEDKKEALPEATPKALEEEKDEVTEDEGGMPSEEEPEKVEEENLPADE